MADRQERYLFRTKSTSGTTVLPADGVTAEPFLNTYEGRMFFYGTSGGTFESPSGQANVFEVGGNIGYAKVLSGININNLFIITGTTGHIINYGGQTNLTDYFLSGTSTGFVLAPISDITTSPSVSRTRLQNGLNTYTAGTIDNPSVNISAATLSYLSANTISANTINSKIIQSGGTDLYSIFLTAHDGNDITRVQSGLNIYTAGTANNPSVNISAATLDNISVSGNAIFNDITFNTGATKPDAYARKVYFDNDENALSYFPLTPNMDVTVNIGQESLIKVFNNTGFDILNGQVCHINGSLSGIPTITLASGLIIYDDSEVSGVATHNILDNNIGFITTFGIIRDLTITGTTPGAVVFLSDDIAGGYEYSINNLSLESRINKIGRVITTGITTGKVLVDISNENIQLSLTDREGNILNGNNSSSGVYEFSGASKVSPTIFNVSQAKGWIVHNTYDRAIAPDVKHIHYTGQTGLTTIYLSGADATYLLINSASTLIMQSTYPTPRQRRENILLSKIVHPDRISIQGVNNITDFGISVTSQLRDMFTPIKMVNQGIGISPYTGLTFQKTAGTLWGLGIGFTTDQLNPDSMFVSAATPSYFYYRTQTGGTTGLVLNIDPTMYDVGGVVTSISTIGDGTGSRSTNQRVYQYPTGVVVVQYGQTVYESLPEAIGAAGTEMFVENSNNLSTGHLIGIISVRRTTSQLSATTYARMLSVSKFGESAGGAAGITTATLQTAYNNSTSPEIITNAILDGVQFRGGTGNDNDKNIIIENNAGAETAWIKANGYSNFIGVSANTVSANTINSGVIQSGGTDLYSIFLTADGGTRVQPGLNTYTAGTVNNPSVNISAATLNNLTVSGASSLATVSATTLFSASTNLTAIFAPISLSQFPIDINRYGFLNHTETGISFDGTDTFTLSGVSWSYYRTGVKYTISGNKTIQVANPMSSNTMYFIYIDSGAGTLVSSTSSWTLNDTLVPVATIFWNAALTPKYILSDERHQCLIDRATHRMEHFTHGTEYISGGIVSGYTLNSTTVTNKTFLITSALIADEDIFHTLNLLSDGDGSTPNYYNVFRTGATSYAWTYNDMPFKYVSGATYGYIEYDNGSGVSTASANNRFVNTYVVCTNAKENYETITDASTSGLRFIMLQGRGSYNTAALAYAEAFSSFSLVGFPFNEAVGIYQITWNTSGVANSVKGRCVINRVQRITANIVSTVSGGGLVDHNTTSGIQGGKAGEYFHLAEESYLNVTSGIFSATTISATTLYSTNISASTATVSTISATTIISGTTSLADILAAYQLSGVSSYVYLVWNL